MKTALKAAVDQIKDAGFGYIKVELEADLKRTEDVVCEDCNGGGYIECDNCNGSGAYDTGYTVGRNNETVFEECDDCQGEGEITCSTCDGEGNLGENMSEGDCQRFIENELRPETRQAMNYMEFYEDGSVDSELTFTLPIENVEMVTEVIEAWNALADNIGNGMDIDGAGMHISVLPTSCNGYYPCEDSDISGFGMENFKKQVTKLMPTLFFLGSVDKHSRTLEYREPQVSRSEKYSAIFTHYDTCLEYRLFETCYEKPESFFDYVEVIANTLKFFANPSLEVKTVGKDFIFPSYGYDLQRFFNDGNALRVLNAQIGYLKPQDKSYRQLKEERGISTTIKDLDKKNKEQVKKLRKEYEAYRKHYRTQYNKPLNTVEQKRVKFYVDNGFSRHEAIRETKNLSRLTTMRAFIQQNLNKPSYEHSLAV
jgi:hypothetical protein